MYIYTKNDSKKINKIEVNEGQITVEKLKHLLKNTIQLNDELEKQNGLLKHKLQETTNPTINSMKIVESLNNIEEKQKQLESIKKENQEMEKEQQNLLQENYISQNKFSIVLQTCQISENEQQFYDYFEAQNQSIQECIINEFVKRIQKLSFNFHLFKDQQNYQKQIEELNKKIQDLQNEIQQLKNKENIDLKIKDIFGSNEVDFGSIKMDYSQKIDNLMHSDKKWLDSDIIEEKQYQDTQYYQQLIQSLQIQLEQLQRKNILLKEKKKCLKQQNYDLQQVIYSQTETCQKIISNLQLKIEKQRVQISCFQSLQAQKNSTNIKSKSASQHNLKLDINNKFIQLTPSLHNSPLSITKYSNNTLLKKQDSLNDATSTMLKTTEGSLQKRIEHPISITQKTQEQDTKPTKLSIHLRDIKQSLSLLEKNKTYRVQQKYQEFNNNIDK